MASLIHVLGVQRTGQHAFISWLIGHYNKVGFKNHMSNGFVPPFWYFEPDDVGNGQSWETGPFREGQDAWILGTEFTNDNIKLSKHVDTQMDGLDVSSPLAFKVIRNPYNHYASVLKWRRNRLIKSPASFKRAWIGMVKKESITFMKEEVELSPVYFDKWFEDKEYRKSISKLLQVPHSDSRLNVVMKIGVGKSWGSSFEGMNKKLDAQKMGVNERWKEYMDNEDFLSIYGDKEIEELAKEMGFEKPKI